MNKNIERGDGESLDHSAPAGTVRMQGERYVITLSATWGDFFNIVLAVLVWAITLRTIWRVGNRW